jgi:uncharacterized protein (DUF305 family)
MQDHSDHMVSEGSEFSAADVMFAQMMIPHHQQAVDMGEIAATRASSPEVLALAKQIAEEQEPEIALMDSWLTGSGAGDHMNHDVGMDGMLTDAELETLEAAKGPEFDRLFLEGMIAHHEGTISMAEGVVDSKNPEVAKLAASIIKSQTEQIQYMKELLGN